MSQIIALLNQVLAALGGLLEIVSIDTGCDARIFRNSDLVMSVGVIVVDDGAKNETEYYEAIEGLLDDGDDTLAENGFLDVVQCVQKLVCDYLNLVIFGRFQNNFQNFFYGSPYGLVLLGNFENFDFFTENYSENVQNRPNFGAGHQFLNAL